MSKRLPKFEGNDVAGARLKINGLGEDLTEALRLGDRVYFCIEAAVNDVAHVKEAKGDTFIRVHKAQILRTGVMDADEARLLLDAETERRRAEEDEAAGREPLPFSGTGRRGRAGEEDL